LKIIWDEADLSVKIEHDLMPKRFMLSGKSALFIAHRKQVNRRSLELITGFFESKKRSIQVLKGIFQWKKAPKQSLTDFFDFKKKSKQVEKKFFDL
jgi:hypothetical protein